MSDTMVGVADRVGGPDGERVDYLKFLVVLPVEEVGTWRRVFEAVFDADHIAHGTPRKTNVGSVKSTPTGDYLYSFETWGEGCHNVVDLPFDQWAPYLHRIDIRRTCDVQQEGLDTLYSWLRDNCGDTRNLQQFNTKPRNKRLGRNAGGIGLQVGSHKSDFRIVVYKRYGEMGAVEINLAGDALKDIVATAMMMRQSDDRRWQETPWRALYLACDMRGQRKAEVATGLPFRELFDMAEGTTVPTSSTEELLAAVDTALDQLPATALYAVLETLQLRLFGSDAAPDAVTA